MPLSILSTYQKIGEMKRREYVKIGQINWMSFTNTDKAERRNDKPSIKTNNKIKTTGSRKIVEVGIKSNTGIKINKTPKLTRPNIAVAVVVTMGKNSRLILIDLINSPFAVILVRPAFVPFAKILKIMIPVIR